MEDNGNGGLQVKSDPDRAAKDELAKIMRGLNPDIWAVNRTERDSMKDKVKRKILEMLPNDDVKVLSKEIEDGELFVRTAVGLSWEVAPWVDTHRGGWGVHDAVAWLVSVAFFHPLLSARVLDKVRTLCEVSI
jgi:hypothetical protein